MREGMTTPEQALSKLPLTMEELDRLEFDTCDVDGLAVLKVPANILLNMSDQARLAIELEAKLEKAKDALNDIAAWDEGETVSGKFDEPGSAHIAREALKSLES